MKKAQKITDIHQAFRGQPLEIDQLKEFYHDTSSARKNFSPKNRIIRTLQNSESGSHQHMLFVGYRGCGKSTELNMLQKEIKDEFLVINYSVMEELDPVHIQYIELFIVTMERLFTAAEEKELLVKESLLGDIRKWLGTREIQEIITKYDIGAEAEIGAQANLTVPFFAKLFGKFKATAKSSRSLKEVLKQNVEPRLSELIKLCNELVKEVYLSWIANPLHKDLLIIIEDLDKIPLDRAENLFVNYVNQLTQIKCNVIYTFPIALYYNSNFGQIKNYFQKCEELPMIKVADKEGHPVPEGIESIKSVVEARMDLSLFENEEILNQMIALSGGCLRDLFYLIRNAAEFSIDEDRTKISDSDRVNAYQILKSDYENTIADYKRHNEVVYTAGEFYAALADLYKLSSKKLDNTEINLLLRQNLTILGYNGEGWCDVHPVVKEILKERELV